MSKKKYGANIDFMMDFVRKFIDEELSRLDFTLDFNHHLSLRFDKMYSENAEAAKIFWRNYHGTLTRKNCPYQSKNRQGQS